MNKLMKATPLTKTSFSKFGDIIEASDQVEHYSINDGFTTRYNNLANIDTLSHNGKTLVNIFRSTPTPKPITIKKMERHPLSSQTFVPLGSEPYLVVVAPQGEFDEDAIEIFLATADQGVNYHAGTWHHFSLALNQISDFLVIDRGDNDVQNNGTAESSSKEIFSKKSAINNCDEVDLKITIQIELE